MSGCRELLQARGFETATRPFPGRDGRPWHYARQLPADGPWNNQTKQGRQYFIQLDSGDWQRWGDPQVYSWATGPWHECLELPVNPDGHPAQTPLARWALQQGVEIVGEPSHVGNIWCRYQGRKLLAVASSRDFVLNWRGVIENAADQRELDRILEAIRGGPDRSPQPRFVPRQSVEPSGRNIQLSLFG